MLCCASSTQEVIEEFEERRRRLLLARESRTRVRFVARTIQDYQDMQIRREAFCGNGSNESAGSKGMVDREIFSRSRVSDQILRDV